MPEPNVTAWGERRAWAAKHGTPSDPECVGAVLADHLMDVIVADTRAMREVLDEGRQLLADIRHTDWCAVVEGGRHRECNCWRSTMGAKLDALEARLAGRDGIGED